MVKMQAVELFCFAFLTGLTLCGLAGSTMELVAGRRGVSALVLIFCTLTSAGWTLATGVVAIDLASRAAVLLS
jgi:hypothetical protein